MISKKAVACLTSTFLLITLMKSEPQQSLWSPEKGRLRMNCRFGQTSDSPRTWQLSRNNKCFGFSQTVTNISECEWQF